MNNGLPRIEHDHVLTGVKAKPFGWPAASPDPGSGRGPMAASGSPLSKHPQTQVSTVSGDCHFTARHEACWRWMAVMFCRREQAPGGR
jgi:hypothetical protein